MSKIKEQQFSAFIKGAIEIAATISEGAAILRSDGLIVFMNERLIEICGDHVGKNIRETIITRNGISPFAFLPEEGVSDGRLHKVVETQSSRGESGILIHLKNLQCPETGRYRLMLVTYSHDQHNSADSEFRLPFDVLAARCSVFSRLAAGVVHEANNHFGGISQSAQVLQNLFNFDNPRTMEILQRDAYPKGAIETIRSFVEKRQAADFVEVISDSSQKAFEVVNAFLDILRASDAELNRCDMNDIVKKALYLARFEKELREECAFREMDVRLKLKNDLPRIMCDQRLLVPAIIFVIKQCCLGMRSLAGSDQSFVPRLTLTTSKKNERFIKLSIACNAALNGALSSGNVLMDAARFLVQEIHQGELESASNAAGDRVDVVVRSAVC